MSHWYLGTIGYSYKDWVGSFYPTGMTQHAYLPYYSKVFNSVELDTTFHSIPRPSIVQSWTDTSPADFRFCLKTPRLITHELGLKGAQGAMMEFIDSVQALAGKLGPILIQLPPKFSQENYTLLADFLTALPNDHQYAIEFRHPSWYNAKTIKLLTEHQVCWVASDYPNLPRQINPTSNILYIRWIGINGMYQRHSYERVDKTKDLKWWLELIRSFEDRVPLFYGFFNNDYAGFAPGTANRFKEIMGLPVIRNQEPKQGRLF